MHKDVPSELPNVADWERPGGVESDQNFRDLRNRISDTPSAMNTVSLHEVSTDVFIERHGVMLSLDELGSDLRGGPTQLNGNGLEFQFNAAPGTPQEVIDGFLEAGLLWSQAFFDDILVSVNISFPELGPGILGETFAAETLVSYSAFQTQIAADAISADDATAVGNLQPGDDFGMLINRTADSPNGAGSGTPYVDDNGDANNTTINLTTANAKAIGGLGIAPGNMGIDADIAFSRLFTWDFDRSDGISAGAFDFVGVAAHEIGHALGFISGVDILDFNSPPVNGPFNSDLFTFVSPLDMYRYSADSVAAAGGPFIDWSADARTKSFSIDGGSTFLTTFSEGVFFGDGSQASHWEDDLGIGIMDPTLAPGELSVISAFDIQAFDVIGWDAVPPPPNDDFADRRDLGSTTSMRTTGNNDGYTGETGEPAQSGTITSAWWSWTAPASGELVVDTNGSDFDAYLTLATGSAVDALTVLDQDDNGGNGLQSQITASVTAGTQYQIAVDGFAADTGAITLNVSFTFPNDDFANRIDLGSAESVTTPGNNVGFTGESGEPPQSDPIQSAWWSWTAPESGILIVDTNGSSFDTFLTLATGAAVDALTVLDQNDDFGFSLQSRVAAPVTAGTEYQIAVDGFSSDTGDIVLNLFFTVPFPNDDFANRIDLGSADSVTTPGNNVLFTGEPGEPPQSGAINSAWWSWTAPATGTVFVNTVGSDFDTFLTLATGSAVDALTVLDQNDDFGGGLQSLVTATVTAGMQYQIAVDGFSSDTGAIVLTVSFLSNDDFANRIDLGSDASVTTTGGNAGFTGEMGEPPQSGPIQSAWWSWTAPASGNLVVDTNGSDFDTFLTLATGSAVDVLSVLDQDDDGGDGLQSLITATVMRGVKYQVAVDGFGEATGEIALNLSFVAFSFVDADNDGLFTAGTDVALLAGEVDDGSFDTQRAEGGYSVVIPGAGLVLGGAAISVGGDLTYRADGDLSVETDLTAGDDIRLISRSGSVSSLLAGPTITALDEISISAALDIDVSDTEVAAGQEVKMTAGRHIFASNSMLAALGSSEGKIKLKAVGDIAAFFSTLRAGEEIELTSTGARIGVSFSVLEAIGGSESEIELEAVGDIIAVASALSAGQKIKLISTGSIIDAFASTMQALARSEGKIKLQAAGGIFVDDAFLSASKAVEVTSTGGFIIADFAIMEALGSADGEIELKAAGEGISAFAATLRANEEIELTATGGSIIADFAVMEALGSSKGEIDLHAAGEGISALAATLVANDDVELTATGGIIFAPFALMEALGSAESEIELEAAGDIIAFGASLRAGEDVELTTHGGSVDAGGAQIVAGDDVEIHAEGGISAAGINLLAGDDVEFRAKTGDINMAGGDTFVESLGGDIEMRASAGSIFGQNGTYTSGNGDIEMTAAVDVDVQNATFTAFDDVELRAGNDLFVQSAVITAGDDIVLTAGDEVFVQDAVLNAGDRVVINGIQVGTPA